MFSGIYKVNQALTPQIRFGKSEFKPLPLAQDSFCKNTANIQFGKRVLRPVGQELAAWWRGMSSTDPLIVKAATQLGRDPRDVAHSVSHLGWPSNADLEASRAVRRLRWAPVTQHSSN